MLTRIAIAVVEQDGRFLIGQRPVGAPLAGLWEFPGGKIEPGETAEQAAVRECREETGLVVQAEFRYPSAAHAYAHGTVELEFIACGVVCCEKENLQPPFRWVERRELAQYEFPQANRELIRQLLAVQN
jgi:8-oxo-dGTP diphosphatase